MKSLGSGQSIILLLAAAAVLAGCSPKPAPEVLAQVGTNSITPADLQADLNKALAEAREFAKGEFTTALHQGAALSADDR